MCLIVKRGPRVSKKDIVCYKLINKECDGNYHTFFRNFDIGKNITGLQLGNDGNINIEKSIYKGMKKQVLFKSESDYIYVADVENYDNEFKSYTRMDENFVLIAEDFFHTYKSIKDISKHLIIASGSDIDFRIIKCVIPANTVYYSGYCYFKELNGKHNTFNSYASKGLTIFEDVTDKFRNKLNVVWDSELTKEQLDMLLR